MKLGYCTYCEDIFKLVVNVRGCACGKASGAMKDQVTAIVNGPLLVLGINDKSLYTAINNQPSHGPGKDFVAYVLPKHNKNVVKIRGTNLPKLANEIVGENVYKNPPTANPILKEE
jgi:hypothetical protein